MKKNFKIMLLGLLAMCGVDAFAYTLSGSATYTYTQGGIDYTVLRVYNTETAVNINTVKVTSNNFTGTAINIPDEISFAVEGTDDAGEAIAKTATFKVVEIQADAFKGITSATSLSIGKNVVTIGASAFENCTKIASVTIAENSELTTIGNSAFGTTPSLTSISFANCPKLTTFAGVTPFVPSAAPIANTELTEITLPAGKVTNIGTAFANLKALTTINNLDKVATLVGGEFANDIALTTLTLPETVTSITGSPFTGCTNLATLTINAKALTTLGTAGTDLFGTTDALENLYITNDVAAAIAAGILTVHTGLTTVEIAKGKEIKADATLTAAAITVADGATIELGKLSKAPGAGFITVGAGAYAESATLTIGEVAVNLTNEIVTGKTATTVGAIGTVAVSADALGTHATSLNFTGEIKQALTAYTAANAELTTINFNSIKMVASTIPTAFNGATQATPLEITWTPADANALAAFAQNAFAAATCAGAEVVTLITTTAVAQGIYLSDELNLFNVIFEALGETETIAMANNGTGDWYYGKFFKAGSYKIAKEQNGGKVIVYGSYVDQSDAAVYMEQLHIIDGYYYVPANCPVIVKSSTNDDVIADIYTPAELAAGVSGMNLWNDGVQNWYVNEIGYVSAAAGIVGTTLNNTTTDKDYSDPTGAATVDNTDYNLYALGKIEKFNITWKKFAASTTLPKGTFYVRCTKAAGARLNVVWLDGSEENTTGIESLEAAEKVQSGAAYNLAGQKVDANYRGLVIKNGKKVIR